MKTLAVLLLLVAPACAITLRQHPVENVIALLQGLSEKAVGEGKEEALAYEKFTYWCRNSEKSLNKAIAEEKTTIDELSDLIESKTKEEEVLTNQIAALNKELSALQASGVEADGSRNGTNALYQQESKALEDTIDAVKLCIIDLEATRESTDTKTAADVLIQRRVSKVLALASAYKGGKVLSVQQEIALRRISRQRPDLKAEGDLDDHTKIHSFKSDSVIELLKGLEAKFKEELLAVTKAETNSLNGYALAKEAREDLTNAATESRGEKSAALTDAQGVLIQATTDIGNERNDLKADTTLLGTAKQQCATKASEWAERSATRKNELEAMKVAIGILSKATGVRTEAPSNPVPPPSPVQPESFLQIVDPKMKAVNLLRKEAKVAHSRALETLAAQVAAHLSGPFSEVNNMIEKMIYRLMDEQKNEDEHKHWCDLELEKTNTSKVDKEDKIAELTAKIDAAVAHSAKLQQDIADSDDMVADITAHMKQATEIRETGKEENKISVKDSEDAQAALSNAIAVLEAFYKESGMVAKESWEFLQRSHQDPTVDLGETPSTWDSSYTGVADPKAQPEGIVTVLEKLSAEFARMESETIAQEQQDQEAYDEDMKECAIEKARRAKESEMKAQEKKRTDDKTAFMSKQRKGVEKEHEAVVQYLEDLQPACVKGDSTYEDRKAARATEITALKEAKDILADAFKKEELPAGFLQRRK